MKSTINDLNILVLQKNSLKNILDPTKSSLSLALYCSLSSFQSLCVLFIQSSMCPCLNPPHPTLSLREYNCVVATTRHSRTNDLTTSKALQWAIK